MPLAGLHEIGGWPRSRVLCSALEGIGAGAVGEVIEPAAADVRNIDAEAQLMFAAGISGKVGAVEMVFRAPRVGLCSTRGEQSGDRDLSVGNNAEHRGIKVSHQEPGLVQPVRRDLVQIADVYFMF